MHYYVTWLLVFFGLLLGCDPASNNGNVAQGDMGGFRVRDAGPDMAAADQGEDAVPVDAQHVDAEAALDAQVDMDVPDQGADAQSADAATDMAMDASVDAVVDGGEEAPQVILRVSRNNGPVPNPQIIEDPSLEADVPTGTWRFCARGGPVDIASVNLQHQGEFDGVFMTFRFGDITFTRPYGWWGELIVLFQDEFQRPFHLEDGECTDMQLVVHLPVDEDDAYLEVALNSVLPLDEAVQVIFDQDNDRQWNLPGLRTVFQLDRRVYVQSLGATGRIQIVGRDANNFVVGQFQLCTEANGVASLSQVLFQLDLQGQGPLPLVVSASTVNWEGQFAFLNDNVNGGDSNGGLFFHGDTIALETLLPNGEPEVLAWGACMDFRFQTPFVHPGIEFIQLHVLQVDSVDMVTGVDQEGSFPLEQGPPWERTVPWDLIQIIDPVELLPFVRAYWGGVRGGNTQDRYFIHPDQPNPCTVQQHQFGNPDLDWQMECQILEISMHATNIDPRFPVVYRDLQISVWADMFLPNDIPIRVEISKSKEEEPFLVVEEDADGNPFIISQQQDVLLAIPPFEVETNSDDAHSLIVEVFVNGELPAQHQDAIIHGEFAFTLEGVEARYFDELLPVLVEGSEFAGDGELGLWPLPYTGARYRLQAPEIWLEQNPQDEPRAVDIARYGGEVIPLMHAFFNNRAGAVEVCGVSFLHGTGKDAAPMESIAIDINGRTFVLLRWDREVATFVAPRQEDCAWASDQGWISITASATSPVQTTLARQPLQFQLIGIVVLEYGRLWEADDFYPSIRMPDPEPWAPVAEWLLPVALGVEGIEPVFLSRETPLFGTQVVIVNSEDPDGDRVCDDEMPELVVEACEFTPVNCPHALNAEGGCDNCPDEPNNDQTDADGDGIGDACDN